MYHEHNSAQHDFPYQEQARLTYFVASLPRSGSTLLCRGLWAAGLAGAPLEYFADVHMEDYFDRWGRTGIRDYVQNLQQHRTSPNGIFGAKGHYPQLQDWFFKQGIVLDELFPNLRYIYITRQDRLRQAISYVKAMQTNRWTSDWQEGLQDGLQYDFKAIDQRMNQLVREERIWGGYFLKQGTLPLRIVYESFVEKYEETLREVLRFLEVEEYKKIAISAPRLKKQADSITEQWYEQYLMEVERHLPG